MKLTDKRLWWFEGIMLICGILSSYLYALNFGICISQIPSIVVFYTLSCLLGSIIAWKVYKNNGALLRFLVLHHYILYYRHDTKGCISQSLWKFIYVICKRTSLLVLVFHISNNYSCIWG